MDVKRIMVTLLVTTVVLAGTSVLIAQASITGIIRGGISDDAGNFLPGATVVVSGEPLGDATRTTVADAEGRFFFNNLPVGVYNMTVRMLGYQPFEMVHIIVDPDSTRRFSVELPEGLTEKVTVQAERPVIDTSNTSSKEVVNATYVNKLPLTSRRYQQIMTLFPGVSNDQGFTLAQYHVNGSRVTQNGYRLDGANINDFVTGTFGLNVNQNSIERFELNTSGYQAEYGEHSGGIANVITKSGTNEFELLYSGFYRGDSWGADLNNFDELMAISDGDVNAGNNNNPRPETQQWQEISFTGPIKKNKVWFATSFQYWQEDVGSLFNDSVRTGDRYHFQFKTTWQVNQDNQFVVNFATDPSQFENLITDARFSKGTNFNQNQGGYFIQFRDTHTFTPSLYLESQLFVHHQYLTARPTDDSLGAFSFIFTPGNPFTAVGTYPVDQDRSTDRVRLSSALTAQKGTHRIKGGLDFSFLDYTGTLRAEDTTLNLDALAYYYAGTAWSYTYQYQDHETDRQDTEFAAFVQDTWVIDEHWTVEGGARVDYQSVVEDNNVSPRLGVAWDPKGHGRTKFYANYGRFYDNVFSSYVDFLDATGLTLDIYYDFGGVPTTITYVYDYAVDGELEAPYKDSWTVGVEHELAWDVKVGLSTTHWDGKNQLRATVTTDLSNVPGSVVLDPAANAAVILDSNGESDYDDYKIMVRKPFSRRFEVIGSYTRSRVRGDTSVAFGFENRSDQRSLDYTRLSYDRPDVINLAAFGNLPRGWETTGIYRYQSGRLYTPMLPNGFVDTSVGGKNSRRMPPLRSLDLSLSKRMNFGGSQAKFTFQVFNVTNETNVIDVDRFTSSGAAFGAPVTVDFGRIYQIGVEFRL